MESGADPRWTQLMGPGADCSCGEHHVGLIDLFFLTPADWPDAPEKEANEAVRTDGNFLSDDYAVRDGKYFAMRCVLPLPVTNCSPPASALVVWASVDKADFEKHLASPRPQMTNPPERFQARLITRIGGYPNSFGLLGVAFPQADSPPLLVLGKPPGDAPDLHPLVAEHRDGASFDRLLEVYAAQGHDMRSSFSGSTVQ